MILVQKRKIDLNTLKEKHKNFFIWLFISLFIAVLVLILEMTSFKQKYGPLYWFSDAFFFSGMIILICLLFRIAVRHGGFDLFIFTGKKIRENFKKKEKTASGKNLTYYDFIQQRKEKKYPPLKHLFIIPGVMLILSLVLALIRN